MASYRLEQERPVFENFLRRNGWTTRELERGDGGHGHYFNSTVASMWCGWIARARQGHVGTSDTREEERGSCGDGDGVLPCVLCAKGFPVESGQHYGTQALGMIPTTPCTAGVDSSAKGGNDAG